MYKNVRVCEREMGNLLQLVAFEKLDQVGGGFGYQKVWLSL